MDGIEEKFELIRRELSRLTKKMDAMTDEQETLLDMLGCFVKWKDIIKEVLIVEGPPQFDVYNDDLPLFDDVLPLFSIYDNGVLVGQHLLDPLPMEDGANITEATATTVAVSPPSSIPLHQHHHPSSSSASPQHRLKGNKLPLMSSMLTMQEEPPPFATSSFDEAMGVSLLGVSLDPQTLLCLCQQPQIYLQRCNYEVAPSKSCHHSQDAQN